MPGCRGCWYPCIATSSWPVSGRPRIGWRTATPLPRPATDPAGVRRGSSPPASPDRPRRDRYPDRSIRLRAFRGAGRRGRRTAACRRAPQPSPADIARANRPPSRRRRCRVADPRQERGGLEGDARPPVNTNPNTSEASTRGVVMSVGHLDRVGHGDARPRRRKVARGHPKSLEMV